MNDDSRRMTLPPFPPEYRASGVLLHVASLLSAYGIGDVGPPALAWVDRLREARQTWWQALPLGPTGTATPLISPCRPSPATSSWSVRTVWWRTDGHEVIDFGANSLSPDGDYPDFVAPLGHAVATGQVERGVAICGRGVGASVCANKSPGVRAALIHDHFSARRGVEDDYMNLLCMGGRTVGPAVAWDLVIGMLMLPRSLSPRTCKLW